MDEFYNPTQISEPATDLSAESDPAPLTVPMKKEEPVQDVAQGVAGPHSFLPSAPVEETGTGGLSITIKAVPKSKDLDGADVMKMLSKVFHTLGADIDHISITSIKSEKKRQ